MFSFDALEKVTQLELNSCTVGRVVTAEEVDCDAMNKEEIACYLGGETCWARDSCMAGKNVIVTAIQHYIMARTLRN